MQQTSTEATVAPATVGVVGVGLIGGSIVRRLQQLGHPVVVTDIDAGVRDALAAEGVQVVDEASAVARQVDLLVLAVPPRTVAPTVQSLAEAGPFDDLTIIDVASTKAPIVAAFDDRATTVAGATVVLTHPMAGRERGGLGAANAHLFDRAAWIVCPHAAMTGRHVQRLHRFVAAMGARMCWMSVEDHERFTAVVSHLPHLLAFEYRAMLEQLDPQGAWRLAGGSLQDLLRVADADRDLWREILTANAAEVAGVRDALVARLATFSAESPAVAPPSGSHRAPATTPDHVQLPLETSIGDATAAALAATGRAGWEVIDCHVDGDALIMAFGRDT